MYVNYADTSQLEASGCVAHFTIEGINVFRGVSFRSVLFVRGLFGLDVAGHVSTRAIAVVVTVVNMFAYLAAGLVRVAVAARIFVFDTFINSDVSQLAPMKRAFTIRTQID